MSPRLKKTNTHQGDLRNCNACGSTIINRF